MNVFEAVMFVMNFVPDLQENTKKYDTKTRLCVYRQRCVSGQYRRPQGQRNEADVENGTVGSSGKGDKKICWQAYRSGTLKA